MPTAYFGPDASTEKSACKILLPYTVPPLYTSNMLSVDCSKSTHRTLHYIGACTCSASVKHAVTHTHSLSSHAHIHNPSFHTHLYSQLIKTHMQTHRHTHNLSLHAHTRTTRHHAHTYSQLTHMIITHHYMHVYKYGRTI